MKYLLLIMITLSCINCNSAHAGKYPMVSGDYIAIGIWKFEDMDNICYTYYNHSISCVKKNK